MKKFAAFACVAALSLGLLTACGGGGGPTQKVTIDMAEGGGYAFAPATISVNKGDKVEVTLNNKDTANDHTFVIKELNANKKVATGKTETYTFTASKQGEFKFYCDVAGHREGGMEGTITVK